MSLVFLSYAYPPLRYPRSIQVARLALHSRHDIRLICGDDGSGHDATIPGADGRRDLEILRVPRTPPPAGSPRWLLDRLLIPDVQRSWALALTDRALAERWLGANDLLVTFGDPMSDHLAGAALARATGAPWIAHFSDPWADNPYRRRLPFTPAVNRALEARVARLADRLVFTSAETVDLVMRKYPPAWRGRTRVLPHAFDPSLYAARPVRRPGKILRHVGNFYPPRSPAPLLAALVHLAATRPRLLDGIAIELVGHIDPRLDFRAALAALPRGLVTMRTPVDYRTSLDLMQDADLLLVIDAPSESSVFLPSKLIDYIGAGRPILAVSPPGAAADLVGRLGGWVAHPENVDAIAEQFAAALSAPTGADSAPWGAAPVRDRYTAAGVAAQFDVIVDELVRERDGAAA